MTTPCSAAVWRWCSTTRTDVEVVGQCGDGQEAVEQVGDLVPDVVLMDIRMPRRGGIEACTAIKDQVPSVKIVMLTISDEEEDLFEAIKAGATGYLLKDVSIDEVADVVRGGARRPVVHQPVDGLQADHASSP